MVDCLLKIKRKKKVCEMISFRLSKNAENLSKVVVLLDSVNMIHAKLLLGSSFFLVLPVVTVYMKLPCCSVLFLCLRSVEQEAKRSFKNVYHVGHTGVGARAAQPGSSGKPASAQKLWRSDEDLKERGGKRRRVPGPSARLLKAETWDSQVFCELTRTVSVTDLPDRVHVCMRMCVWVYTCACMHACVCVCVCCGRAGSQHKWWVLLWLGHEVEEVHSVACDKSCWLTGESVTVFKTTRNCAKERLF